MNNINLKISKKNKIKSTYEADNNDIYDILSQDSFLMLNRKLYSVLGLELATFITFLVDKEKYYKNNDKLDNQGYFYITNSDLLLHTGIKSSRINNLKNESVERNLLYLKKAGIPLKTYYKVNISQVREIIYNSKSSLDLAYNRLINDENLNLEDLNSFSISTLEQKTYRDLRLICKNLKISYSGNDKKIDLINKIMLHTEQINEEDNFSNKVNTNNKDLNKYTTLSLRNLCKNLKISYSGNDKKIDLINKIMLHTKVDNVVDKDTNTKNEVDNVVDKDTNTKNEVDNVVDKDTNTKNEVDNVVDKDTNTKNEVDLEKIKSLVLSFEGLDLKWNNSLEKVLIKFLKKHKLSLTIEYLTSNYKNIMENSSIINKSGCFISLIKKEQRQINTKNEVDNVVDKDINTKNEVDNVVDNNLETFKKLDEYKKLKIEELAINDYIKTNNLNNDVINSLITLKQMNLEFYYKTLEHSINLIISKTKIDNI